jgi:predicted MFS family arabinose efflux permease
MLDRVVTGALIADALAGLRYVLRNRELRGIAVATSVMNVGFGILSVALPVLVLSQLHQGASSVGGMYAVMGAAGLLATVFSGRVTSAHREVWLVVCGCLLSTMAMAIMLLAARIGGGLVVVTLGMALFGISQGPYDVGMFSLRQRVTAPSWMGRAFAVSMALNFIGMPIGSAVAGPLAERSVSMAFALAVLANLISGGAALVLLRPRAAGPRM